MSKPNEYDTYIIPPNFIEGGTFFGGLLKLRNTAEALVIVLAIGMPVFSVSALTLTAKIIILCLTALPLGIIALVGINGESLSSFIFLVLKYLCNRRIITRNEEGQDKRKKRKKRKAKSGDDAPKYINPVAEYLPVEKIENGIIYTRDHRYADRSQRPSEHRWESWRRRPGHTSLRPCKAKCSPLETNRHSRNHSAAH